MNETPKVINEFTTYLKRKGKTKSTTIAYENDIKQLNWASTQSGTRKSIINLNEEEIKVCLKLLQNSKSLSTKTLSRKLNSIRTFFKFLQDKKIIKSNPAISIAHPKFRNKKPRILTRAEYLELKEISRDNIRLYTMVDVMLQTGLRIGELARLKIKDINLDKSKPFLMVQEFGSIQQREVPLNSKAVKSLKVYIEENTKKGKNEKLKTESALFTTKTGKAIEIRNIRSSIDRVILKAKIKDASVNDLRNTFIVYQLSQGMPLNKIASIVGHKNIVTTMRYFELLQRKYKSTLDIEVKEL